MAMVGSITIGIIIGSIANVMMPGRDHGGLVLSTFLGVSGALVAGYVGRSFGYYRPDDPVGLASSVVGAMILLIVARLIINGRTRSLDF